MDRTRYAAHGKPSQRSFLHSLALSKETAAEPGDHLPVCDGEDKGMDGQHDEASAVSDLHDRSTTMAQAHEQVASPTASRVVARLYGCADRPLRVQLLACLLRPLSPLGLAAVAAGAFAGLLHRDGVVVAIDEVARFSSQQIAELARFVEQVEPNALEQFATLGANNQEALTTFGAAALVLLMRALRRSGTAKAESPDDARRARLHVVER